MTQKGAVLEQGKDDQVDVYTSTRGKPIAIDVFVDGVARLSVREAIEFAAEILVQVAKVEPETVRPLRQIVADLRAEAARPGLGR